MRLSRPYRLLVERDGPAVVARACLLAAQGVELDPEPVLRGLNPVVHRDGSQAATGGLCLAA